jgi:hypothetical protein
VKRSVTANTAAVRALASELSGIVATLVIGAEVEQLDASGGWVRVRTADGRDGWVPETDLGPPIGDTETLIDTQRDVLQAELDGVEQSQVGTLVAQLEQIAETREGQAAEQPTGWEFTVERSGVAFSGKNYTLHAIIALVLYWFMWVPGLVVNIMFLNQANRERDTLGKDPQGKGCLVALLWVFGILPVVIIVLLLVIGIMVAEENGS